MKKNNQGFMLIEALVMSMVIIGVLIFMFIQFQNINRSYDKSFKYNTVTGIYITNEIINFLEFNDYLDELKANVNNSTNNYINIYSKDDTGNYSCNSVIIQGTVCSELMSKSNIERVILIYFETDNDLKGQRRDGISDQLNDFINYLKKSKNTYRIVIEYKDNTYASIQLKGE